MQRHPDQWCKLTFSQFWIGGFHHRWTSGSAALGDETAGSSRCCWTALHCQTGQQRERKEQRLTHNTVRETKCCKNIAWTKPGAVMFSLSGKVATVQRHASGAVNVYTSALTSESQKQNAFLEEWMEFFICSLKVYFCMSSVGEQWSYRATVGL